MGSLMQQAAKQASTASADRFLKMAIYGGAGTGKTTLAIDIAIGLVKHFKIDKPIVLADSEKGAQFHRALVEKETGRALVDLPTANFEQMVQLGREAERDGAVFIIDSASAFWAELIDALRVRLKLRKLQPHHYVEPKAKWKSEFTTWMLNAEVHIIVCGRAGVNFSEQEDEQTGRMEMVSNGTKMKAEGDFGYEPHLVVEMEQNFTDKRGRKARSGALKLQGLVRKDRWRELNGKLLDWPTFKSFLPHVKNLPAAGEAPRVDFETKSEYGEQDGEREKARYARDRKIEVDLVKADLVKVHGDGRSAADKQAKIDSLHAHWGTRSWEEINLRMPIAGIRAGRQSFEAKHGLGAPDGKSAAEIFGEDDVAFDQPEAGEDAPAGDAAA
jgi:hypothetical protein